MPLFAEVAVNSYLGNDKNDIFDYKISDNLVTQIEVGMRVIVPFNNRKIEGYILNIKEYSDVDEKKIKEIYCINDLNRVFNKKQIELAKWMSEEYFCSIGECLKCIIPNELIVKESKYICISKYDNDIEFNDIEKEIIKKINSNNGIVEEKKLRKAFNKDINYSLRKLIDKNVLSIKYKLSQNIHDKKLKYIKLNKEIEYEKILKDLDKPKTIKQLEVLKLLLGINKPIELKKFIIDNNISISTIKTLKSKRFIDYEDYEVFRDPYKNTKIEKSSGYNLSIEQKNVIDKINNNYYNKGQKFYLLHGVTGSGKTEIYIRLIEGVIKNRKQAIMLVPEIALTPQTIERFKGRFKRVAILHSRLSAGEKYDEWKRIKNGDVDVVIGARSAVFAPLLNIGIIIIDEEHENTYKSDKTPKYNAKEVAYKICEMENAMLVLGSATPSIETYYNANNGRYIICNMNNRIDNRKLPNIRVVDMRDEINTGNTTIFSRELYSSIKEALNLNHQVILFLNRRGYSTFISCRKCGYVLKCPKCDVSLTYHIDLDMVKCHYCGHVEKNPKTCPSCKSNYIKYFGIGTQKIENEVLKYFPNYRVIRMDMDTTSKKGAHEILYNKFKNHEADILIGTQMISKGLDFPNVTVVGIIAADTTLNIPDYKSCERTYQLITQVAGRSGRGECEGKVIVQTYNPEHYSIIYAAQNNYLDFYEKEILIRKSFHYPPLSDIVYIVLSSNEEEKTINTIKELAKIINEYKTQLNDIDILGPSPAAISKINSLFRWQIILKGNINNYKKNMIKKILDNYKNLSDIIINMDVNPTNMI